MTTSRASEVASRRNGRGHRDEILTFADDLRASLLSELEASTRITFPSDHYARDPVRFAHEILGVEPWSRQCEILCAVRDYPRVAIRSGHKIGKSTTAAICALWFYSSFRDARVVLTSTTSRQVDQILWREVRMLRARGGRCLDCKREDPEGLRTPRPCAHSALIDGEPGELARTGIKSDDYREIVGF